MVLPEITDIQLEGAIRDPLRVVLDAQREGSDSRNAGKQSDRHQAGANPSVRRRRDLQTAQQGRSGDSGHYQ